MAEVCQVPQLRHITTIHCNPAYLEQQGQHVLLSGRRKKEMGIQGSNHSSAQDSSQTASQTCFPVSDMGIRLPYLSEEWQLMLADNVGLPPWKSHVPHVHTGCQKHGNFTLSVQRRACVFVQRCSTSTVRLLVNYEWLGNTLFSTALPSIS